MDSIITLGQSQERRVFHGGRASGQQLRMKIDESLNASDHVTLDFSGVGVVTQSFIDEAIGVLILEYGPQILNRLGFKHCNEDIKAVIRYVAATRSEDFRKQNIPLIH